MSYIERYASIINNDYGYISLGEYCQKHGLYQLAVEAFGEAVKHNPRNAEAEMKRGRSQRALERQQQQQEQQGLPMSSDLLEWWQKLAEKGQYSEAVRLFEKLARRFPTHKPILEYLARAYEHVGHHKEAYETYRRFYLDGENANDDAYFRLAAHAAQMGLHQEAHNDRLAALTLNPFNHLVRRLVNEVNSSPDTVTYVTGDEYREDLAFKICRQPADTVSGEKLYSIFIEDRDLQTAERTFHLLQEVHPQEAIFYEYLAYVYVALEKPRKALDEFALARRLAPEGDYFYLDRTAEEAALMLGLDPQEAVVAAIGEADAPDDDQVTVGEDRKTAALQSWQGRALDQLIPHLAEVYAQGSPTVTSDADDDLAKRVQEAHAAIKEAFAARDERQAMVAFCALAAALLDQPAERQQNDAASRALYGELFLLLDEVPDALETGEGLHHVAECLARHYRIRDVDQLLTEAQEILPVLRIGEQQATGRVGDALEEPHACMDVLTRMRDLTDHNARLEYYARANRYLGEGRRLLHSSHTRLRRSLFRSLKSTLNTWQRVLDKIHAGLTAAADIRLNVRDTLVEADGDRFDVVLEVANRGKNTAENVAVTLVSTADFRVAKRNRRHIGILAPWLTETVTYESAGAAQGDRKTSFALEFSHEFSDLDSGAVRKNEMSRIWSP